MSHESALKYLLHKELLNATDYDMKIINLRVGRFVNKTGRVLYVTLDLFATELFVVLTYFANLFSH